MATIMGWLYLAASESSIGKKSGKLTATASAPLDAHALAGDEAGDGASIAMR
jgi:hypothetical protein